MAYITTYYFTTPNTNGIQKETLYGVSLEDVSNLFWSIFPDAHLIGVDDPQLDPSVEEEYYEDEDCPEYPYAEDCDEEDLEVGFDPYVGDYTFDC